MRTTDWDRLASSTPLNADAARAWVYSYEDNAAPVPFAQVVTTIAAEASRDPNFRNLVGVHKGRLTVVAYGGSSAKSRGGARWVVQCRCGRYELRRTKSITKGKGDCCLVCNGRQGAR